MSQKHLQSKSNQISDELKQKIISGEYPPGAQLVIDTLAAELGISAIPVREALRQLDADGFVVITPYVGTHVSEINIGSIRETFGLLEAMEIISGQIACQTMSEEDFDELARMINAMDELVDQPDDWSIQNRALHRFICEKAGTQMVLRMMDKVFDHWDRLRMHYLDDVFVYRIQNAQTEHRQLLRALRRRNPEMVQRIIQYHNYAALMSYLEHLENTKAVPPGTITDLIDV